MLGSNVDSPVRINSVPGGKSRYAATSGATRSIARQSCNSRPRSLVVASGDSSLERKTQPLNGRLASGFSRNIRSAVRLPEQTSSVIITPPKRLKDRASIFSRPSRSSTSSLESCLRLPEGAVMTFSFREHKRQTATKNHNATAAIQITETQWNSRCDAR